MVATRQCSAWKRAANLGALLGRDHRGSASWAGRAPHVGQGLVADKAPAAATAGAADRCGPGNTRINLGMASILLVVARNEGRARRRRVERCRGGRRAGKSDASLFAR